MEPENVLIGPHFLHMQQVSVRFTVFVFGSVLSCYRAGMPGCVFGDPAAIAVVCPCRGF